MKKRMLAVAAVTAMLATSLVACSSGGSTPKSSDGTETAVLRTDYKVNGYVAPFALAVERGYYKDAGLKLTIEQGQGSATTVQTVASGGDQFGMADATTVVRAIANQKVPVKMLSVNLQTIPTGLITLPDANFDGTAQGLKGRPIISSPGNAELAYLDALLASNGMSKSDVDLRLVDTNARLPTFLQTKSAVLLGFSTGDLVRVQAEKPDAQYKSFADFGLTSYGTGTLTSASYLKDHPKAVQAFVDGSRKGWEEAVKDPQAAVDAASKMFPDVDKELISKGLDVTIKTLLHTDATKDLPLGVTADSDWKAMLQLQKDFADFKGSMNPTDYYASEFNK